MFEVHAFLVGDADKTVFDGTMNFLPRLEEMITIGGYKTFKVKAICYEYAERKEIIAVSMNPIEVGYSHTYYATVLYKDDDEGLV